MHETETNMKKFAIFSTFLISTLITPILSQIANSNTSDLISNQQNGNDLFIAAMNTTNSGSNAIPTNISLLLPETIDKYDYIFKFQYYLVPEKVPEYLIDIILNNFTQYNLAAADIIKLIGIGNCSLNYTIQLLDNYKLPIEKVFSVNVLEKLLNISGLNFNNYYEALKNKLNLSGPTIMEAMDNLEVDKNKFSGALTFELYNMFDVLRNGTYTEENVNKALHTINRTRDELFNSTRDIIFDKLSTLEASRFKEILNEYQIDKIKLLLLWNIFNVTMLNVNEVENFRIVFDNILANLNETIKLGIVVGPHKIITHKYIFHQWWEVQNIAKGYVQPLTNASANYEVSYRGVNPGSNIVELYLSHHMDKFVNISTNCSSSIRNCSYITVRNKTIVEEAAEITGHEGKSAIVIRSIGGFGFNLGNPLICNNNLYGLAARQINQTGIIVDVFDKITEINTTTHPPNSTTDIITSNAQSHFVFSVFIIAFSIYICLI